MSCLLQSCSEKYLVKFITLFIMAVPVAYVTGTFEQGIIATLIFMTIFAFVTVCLQKVLEKFFPNYFKF